MLIRLGLVLCGFLSSVSFAAVPVDLESKIDHFVDAYQPAPNMGMAVAIVRNGSLEFFKGYGYRDRLKKLPVTRETLFAIGSNSKAFTSLAISMLADQGKAHLEEPVKNQIKGFSLQDSGVSDALTAVDMLSHRTGLPRHDLLWYITPFSRHELFKKLPFLSLNQHPGMGFRQGFQYNNLMYMTIGLWIEMISRQTWENFITHGIFAPLEMSASNTSVAESQASADFAQPYVGDKQLLFKNIEAIGPAGSINSNINDLVKWVNFHLRHGKTASGKALLSEAQHERLFRVESDASSLFPGDDKVEYGLGWFLSDIGSRRVVWHGGNIDGFSSFVSFVPSEDLAVIILTNESHGNAFEFPITIPANSSRPAVKLLPLQIYESLFGIGAPRLSLSKHGKIIPFFFDLSRGENLKEHSSFSLQTSEYSGQFGEAAYGDSSITQQGETLTLNYYSNIWTLEADSAPDQFHFTLSAGGESASVPLKFHRDAKGGITGFSVPFEPEVDEIFFRKIN